jgi:hypothetical protein
METLHPYLFNILAITFSNVHITYRHWHTSRCNTKRQVLAKSSNLCASCAKSSTVAAGSGGISLLLLCKFCSFGDNLGRLLAKVAKREENHS